MKINITPHTSRILRHLTAGALALGLTATAHAQGTGFTYQGRLNSGGVPYSGAVEFQPTLWNAVDSGAQLAANSPAQWVVTVTNGLFVLPLDFGANFPGADRWLQLEVRTAIGPFTALAPRQKLTATPYALHATAAGSVPASGLTGTVPNANLPSSPTFTGTVQAAQFQGGGAGLTGLDAAQVTTGTLPDSQLPASVARTNQVWLLGGNTGTTTNNFLGTTDGQALQLRVNNARALRLEPGIDSPNLIGGPVNNSVLAGVQGATIAGGGNRLFPHEVKADYGTVGGGVANSVGGTVGVIAGGSGNAILTNASFGTISGGAANTVQGSASFIGGGRNNRTGLGTSDSVIGGGYINTNNAYCSALLGGEKNIVRTNSDYAFLGAGLRNLVDGDASSVLGGRYNSAQGLTAVLLGGESNRLTADAAFLGGGQNNTNSGLHSVLVGGLLNRVETTASQSFIGGGYFNVMQGPFSVIGGGQGNTIQPNTIYATIGGGYGNTIQHNAYSATIGGGDGNTIQTNANCATIGGGYGNTIQTSATYATIGGGAQNTIQTNANYATIGGGAQNTIQTSATYATIGGGAQNTIYQNAQYATIPGGWNNEATDYAFAAGKNAKALHTGAFVWSDASGTSTESIIANSVTFRASGGYRLFSSSGNAGVFLAIGSGTWTAMSDRNTKENFEAVNPREVLDKVAALPVSRWNYKTQPANVRHVGPMAQDFHAAFAVGESDTGITTVDADGVALAAIQGLNQKLEEKNAALAKQVEELKALVETLAQKVNGGGQ